MTRKRMFKHKPSGHMVFEGVNPGVFETPFLRMKWTEKEANIDSDLEEVFDRNTPEGMLRDLYHNDDRFKMADMPYNDSLDMVIEAMEQYAGEKMNTFKKACEPYDPLEAVQGAVSAIISLKQAYERMKTFAQEVKRMYEEVDPVGGWQWIHDESKHILHDLEHIEIDEN